MGETLHKLTFLSFANFLEYADEEFVRSGDYVTYRKEKLREGEMGTIRAISLRDKRPARWEQLKQEAAASHSTNVTVSNTPQSSTISGKQFSTAGVTMSSGGAQAGYGIHTIRNLSLEVP